LHRHAQDYFILDDQPRHCLADGGRLRSYQAKQKRQNAPNRSRAHEWPIPMSAASQQSVECSMNYGGRRRVHMAPLA
jgi:hypothetical protein